MAYSEARGREARSRPGGRIRASGVIGAFAEASRSDGLWQRRFVFHGERYLGPFRLRGQAGIAPPDKEGSREL